MSLKIEFLATMRGKNCVAFDDEMEGTIKLITDCSQLPNTMKLSLMKKKLLRVTIELAPE